MQVVEIDSPTDLDGFRREARRLLAAGVAPEAVTWEVATEHDRGLFEPASHDEPPADDTRAAMGAVGTVPRGFVEQCAHVVLHRDPSRFALMYRLLWRLTHEPALRHDTLDPDRLLAHRMFRAVKRDMHKMTAFVRFRTLHDDAGPLHVAWFEPDHHIVEATAPFFARRFAQMRWAILTPERCVRWDGMQLAFEAGARRDEAPAADAGERLWLTYYEHIFNPARLKLAMMVREMPRRYWKNLPEAELIVPLADRSARRTGEMLENPPSVPARRLPARSFVVHARATPSTMPRQTLPSSLSSVAAAIDRCRECPIGALATQGVPGAGPVHAPLMLVGEQPGDQEDLRGQPFVGPAGQLLDRAMAQLGWPRDALYLTNAVKHFKFELRGKRRIHKTAAQREALACQHWLEDEIRLVKPRAIVALGSTASRSLLGHAVAVMSERGRWLQRADGIPVLIALHPSALLRLPPEERREAEAQWVDDLAEASGYVLQAA